jgi:hypothetical protein
MLGFHVSIHSVASTSTPTVEGKALRMKIHSIKPVAVLLFALTVVPALSALDSVIRISDETGAFENDPGGWMFSRDPNNATPFEFTTNESSIGWGSLYVMPIGSTASHKFIGELFLIEEMANIESISYDFKIGAGGDSGDSNQFYANVYANFAASSPTKFYDCRYAIVPASGSTSGFTTVTFDPTASYSVATRTGAAASPLPCPDSPAAMGAGAVLRAFVINLGDTSPTASDQGLSGYFDKVVVTKTTGVTTYDFEADPQTPEACKDGGWMDFGFDNQGLCIRYVNTGKF